MQFSESWLRTLVNPPISTDELSHRLTMAGLEVEDTVTVAPAFSGVVVALIQSAEPHPNADKLRVCMVDVGAAAPLQIVCGAPNAAVGLKVPLATVGAILPGELKIGVATMRGVESFGMLCSAKELGLSQEYAGLLVLPPEAKVGVSLREALDLDDTFEVCERNVFVNPKAFNLMKHRRMRGVTIHTISTPGCNHFDGRLMHACVTHLHRTRVCAK